MRVTKLIVPSNDASFIARPRLDELGDRLPHVPLATISAPAGFGKSTVLRSWAARLAGKGRIAWLSLDAQDASATAFIEGCYLALQRALPDLSGAVRRLLDDGATEIEPYVATLVNELYVLTEESGDHVLLFLDDLHAVDADPGAMRFLTAFLRALPPKVHVAAASRSALAFSPVPKLRAAHAIVELGEAELRFRAEEAESLVADRQRADALVERTDGWAMALQLSSRIDPGAEFPRSRDAIFNFLAEEVLELLDAQLRERLFLLALPETIDTSLASFLLQVDAESVLRGLADRGLYLSRLGPDSWRFHHLFREFLLERFRRDEPAAERAARKRLARMLRERGDKMEALEQLVEAGEYLEIVDYVHEALIAISYTDRKRQILQLLSHVPEAVKESKPMLYRLHAMALQELGFSREAEEQLNRCFDAAQRLGDAATACAAKLELGTYSDNFRFLGHGQFAASERHFREALEIAEGAALRDRPGYRKVANWCLGMALALKFEYDEALQHLAVAEELEVASAEHSELIFVEAAMVRGWTGDWRKALQIAEFAEELLRSGGATFHVGHALAVQSRAHLALREDVTRASALAAQALLSLRQEHQEEELAGAYTLVARCALAVKPPDIEGARLAAAQAERRLKIKPNPVVRFDLSLLLAEIGILAHDLEDAGAHLDAARDIALLNRDPWQQAMHVFVSGIASLVAGREGEARERFADAQARFHSSRDRFHEHVARLANLAAAARAGDLERAEVEGCLSGIESAHAGYVCATAARSTTLLLAWCLTHDCEPERAELLFGPYVGEHAAQLASLAQNEALPARARAAAIRIIAKVASAEYGKLFAMLARDADTAVAATATAASALLPQTGVPALRVDVVGPLRVSIGGNVFDDGDARWGRRRAAELLRLLAVARGPLTKSAVLEALWPDSGPGAETTLRVTLHLLRRALQPEVDGAGDYVEFDNAILRLRSEAFEGTDAAEAENALKRGQFLLARGEVGSARAALLFASQTFARAPREESVAPWLRPHVAGWRESCAQALRSRCQLERKAGVPAAALAAVKDALRFDPLDEESLCLLLELHFELGEYEAARTAFAAYKHRLADELGAAPGPQALAIYSKILSTRAAPARQELSEREHEVLALVARGCSNKEIAARLDLSPWTVNNHLAKILKKLKVESRAAAVAVVGGLIDS